MLLKHKKTSKIFLPEYQRMSDALVQVGQAVGKNFVFSLCEWGWVSKININCLT